jgi:uncharacterized Zn finger protein (UPF0148 family)
MGQTCTTCGTPLDETGGCVTCAAAAEGLRLLSRSGYDQAREMQLLLEDRGVTAEIERVPPGNEQERHHPRWNLYAPEASVEEAKALLRQDWAALLGDPASQAAAARGDEGIDLDQGGEIACPACGHRFAVSAEAPDCPECGLSLGAPVDGTPGQG